jgi:predicted DNA-binding transcriptional regulator AlpA
VSDKKSRLAGQREYPPRGLRAPHAAAYLGMSESSFLSLVAEGRMPRPKKIRGMAIWDRHELDDTFDNLTGEDRPRRNTCYTALGIPEK